MCIGDASSEVADALVKCGRAALGTKRACGADVTHGRYSLSVFVKRSPTVVARRPDAEYMVMVRADVEQAQRLGLPGGKDLDMFLHRQEQAVGALVQQWRGSAAPFPGRRVALDVQAPEDEWCGHVVTVGHHRVSNWFVLREGAR